MIRHLGILSLLLISTYGMPITYDQRQDGNLNFHAKLDNIMVVIAIPGDKGSTSLFSDIASQILELRGLSSRSKQVLVEDERIVESGKDPLNVRILRIEGQGAEENVSQVQGSSTQSGEPQAKRVEEIQSKTLEIPKNEDINAISDKGFKNEEISETIETKNSSENQEILINLGIAEKNEKIIPKSAENSENILENPKKDLSEEKIPQKLISFGTIVSVDQRTGQVIDNLENEKGENIQEKSDDKKKIVLEKKISQKSEEIIPKTEEKIRLEDLLTAEKSEDEKISKSEEKRSEIPEIQILARKLENQEIIKQEEKGSEKVGSQEKIHPEEEKIAVHIQDEVIPQGRRVQREFRVPSNDSAFSKSRMSLKKELPRIDDGKEEEAGDKNEVRFIPDQKSHLKLIGDSIEDCGPDRIRNRYGICQFDGSFN